MNKFNSIDCDIRYGQWPSLGCNYDICKKQELDTCNCNKIRAMTGHISLNMYSTSKMAMQHFRQKEDIYRRIKTSDTFISLNN